MPNNRAKKEAEKALGDFKEAIFVDGKHKYARIRDATKDICCERILINGRHIPKFQCAVGLCDQCPKYKPLPFEINCNEHIKFNIFAHRKYCSQHIDAEIVSPINGDEYCSICNGLSEKEISTFKKAASIKTKKLRVLTSLPMNEFYAVDGFFHKTIREYLFHQLIVTCQSPSFFNKYRREQFLSEEGKGILMTVRDHADKWKMCANREIQTEHFVEDQALGIEGAYLEMHVNIGENGETEQ